jgi:hypothetical protein
MHTDAEIPCKHCAQEFYAVLRMLERRATWLDKLRARRIPGYWLNCVRRDLLVHETTKR